MTVTITQEDNLILQSYYTVLLFKELGEVNFEESSAFDNLNLPAGIKKSLKDIKIQNQGSAILALYAMLVVPKELIEHEFQEEYRSIDDFLRNEVTLHKTTYKNQDESNYQSISFIRHVRNSVAHAKVSFDSNISVTFNDRRVTKEKGGIDKVEEISFSLPLTKFGGFLNSLQNVHMSYIQKRVNPQSSR